MSDEELLAEARKFEKNLLNFFWRQGVQYSEGEDLVQETYMRLWKYRREYKRRFARMKNGRIDPAAFYAWSAEARQKEAECESGKISFEEFKAWLKRE